MVKRKQGDSGIKMLTDQPLGGTNPRDTSLLFDDYADVLSKVAIGTPGPFNIGVFADWGMGKTSLMQLIMKSLDDEREIENVSTVWFNAWLYEQTKVPLIPLINTIIREIRKNQKFLRKLLEEGKYFLAALESVIAGLEWNLEIAAGPVTASIGGDHQKMHEHAEKLEEELGVDVIDDDPFSVGLQKLAEVELPDDMRIIVFIDDLDRCFPEKAIKLLENIKLILEKKGFIFFLGLDRKILESYLNHMYEKEYGLREREGNDYLGKLIQLSFPIPPHAGRMEDLAKNLLKEIEDPIKENLSRIVPKLAEHLGDKPRTLVRLINNLILDVKISNITMKKIPVEFFGISRILQLRWGNFYKLVLSNDSNAEYITMSNEDKWREEIKNEDKYADLARELLFNSDLVKLLGTPEGINWLIDHETRKSATQFLYSSGRDLAETKEKKSYVKGYLEGTGNKEVYIIVAGDDYQSAKEMQRSIQSIENNYERENNSTHRTVWANEASKIQLPLPEEYLPVLVVVGTKEDTDRYFCEFSEIKFILNFTVDPIDPIVEGELDENRDYKPEVSRWFAYWEKEATKIMEEMYGTSLLSFDNDKAYEEMRQGL